MFYCLILWFLSLRSIVTDLLINSSFVTSDIFLDSIPSSLDPGRIHWNLCSKLKNPGDREVYTVVSSYSLFPYFCHLICSRFERRKVRHSYDKLPYTHWTYLKNDIEEGGFSFTQFIILLSLTKNTNPLLRLFDIRTPCSHGWVMRIPLLIFSKKNSYGSCRQTFDHRFSGPEEPTHLVDAPFL